MRGERIYRVIEIQDILRENPNALLWHNRWDRTISAEKVAQMPIRMIVGWIRMGWLYTVGKAHQD